MKPDSSQELDSKYGDRPSKDARYKENFARSIRKEVRINTMYVYVTIIFFVVWLIVLSILVNSATGRHLPDSLMLLLFLMPFCVALAISTLQTGKIKQLSQNFMDIDDTQHVGVLIEALEHQGVDVRVAAVSTLTKLLPALKTTDCGIINTHQWNCLYRVLEISSNPSSPLFDKDFVIAILIGCERIGESHTLAHLSRLSNIEVKTIDQNCIKQQAVQSLGSLRTYLTIKTNRSELLRNVDELGSISSDNLLRPNYLDD